MSIANWIIILIVVLAFAGVMIYLEFIRSKYVLSVNRRAVTVIGLPREMDGIKFAVVGDLHSASFGDKNSELVRKIKREKPDYVLFTGNMGDYKSMRVEEFYDFLDGIGKDIPVVMVPGYEDLRLGKGKLHNNFVKSVTAAGGIILNNTRAEINVGDKKIYIYGFCPELATDRGKSPADWKFRKVRTEDVANALGECPKDATVILLTNYAKGFEAYSRWGASFVIAGGTHGGYCRVPLINSLLREKTPLYTGGEYRFARCKMYVNRGLSSSKKIRFNNPPEISILNIVRANSPLLKTLPVNTDSVVDSFGHWFGSESRALLELLNERTNTLRDWVAYVTKKEQSVYARLGSEKMDDRTYMSQNARAHENARRVMKASEGKEVRRISRVKTRSEYMLDTQTEPVSHSYDKFKTVEEIENIKVFENISV